MIFGHVKKGMYFDSVTLMNVARRILAVEGIHDAAVVMGTKENKEILASAGLLSDGFAETDGTDLLIALDCDDQESADGALAALEEQLADVRKQTEISDDFRPGSIEGSLDIFPEANLAVISVPGQHAAAEAEKALAKDLHVMLFSDNVSLEDEVRLKKMAREKQLLLMGPDCGTAIINGVPLGFANAVNRGNIGIVAAAGTGLQEVSSIISNNGGGISQAIGTGGRDVKAAVGGIMFTEAIKALAEDDATAVVVLVSKPPDAAVLASLADVIVGVGKPVVAAFLGAQYLENPAELPGVHTANTLEEAALFAVAIAKQRPLETVSEQLRKNEETIKALAAKAAGSLSEKQRFIRGLFSGGTLCSEAQIILGESISPLYSNAPAGNAKSLAGKEGDGHIFIDLGEDEFTVGRPHPMIDFSLRNQHILDAANDPATAVILLDVVLGYGSHPDPAGELGDVIKVASRTAIVIASITGTEKDPQKREHTRKTLEAAGAIVMETNAAACSVAGGVSNFSL